MTNYRAVIRRVYIRLSGGGGGGGGRWIDAVVVAFRPTGTVGVEHGQEEVGYEVGLVR